MTMLQRALRAAPAVIVGKSPELVSQSGKGPTLQTSGGLVWLDNQPDGGPIITEYTAPTVIAFFRCVAIIATTCGRMPLHVFQPSDGGADAAEERVESFLDRYLWDQPNPEMSRVQLWETAFGHNAANGNTYLLVVPRAGLPAELWPIQPTRVKPGRTRDGVKVYEIDHEIPMVDYAYGGDIVHIPGFGYDGVRGYNPVTLASLALSVAKSAEQSASQILNTGAIPPAVLETDKVLQGDQAERLRDRWERFHSGTKNRNRIAILDAGAKFKSVSVDAETMQHIEQRKFQVTEMARLFGVPPFLVADVEKSTSWGSGIESQNRGFVAYTLGVYFERFEQKLNTTVLAGSGRRVKFNIDALLRGNTKEQYDALAVAINNRMMSPNEARKKLDLPAWPETEGGDKMVTPAGAVAPGTESPNPESDDDEDQDETADSRAITPEQANAAGILIRSGYTPKGAAAALRIPEFEHTGLLPVTLKDEPEANKPEAQEDEAEPED